MNNGNGKGVSIINADIPKVNDNGDIILRTIIHEEFHRMVNFESWQKRTMLNFQNRVNFIIDDLLCRGLITCEENEPIEACMKVSIKDYDGDNYFPKFIIKLKATIKGRKEECDARKLTKH